MRPSHSFTDKESSSSPPWEVLVLVSQHLDPKTLAMASCVSKLWSASMSSDHLWKPICTSHFPSFSCSSSSSVSYRRLFAIAHVAAVRRKHAPSKSDPFLSDLIFTLNVTLASSSDSPVIVSLAKPAEELSADPNGIFRFDITVDCELPEAAAAAEVKIAWNVVLKGRRAVFTMMDSGRKMRFAPAAEGSCFSEELPPPGCCYGAAGSGIVADLKLRLGGTREGGDDGRVRVEKVDVGILSVVNWRYLAVEDALRYLQHFLLPISS